MDMGFADQHWPEIAGISRDSDAPLRPLGWHELCSRLAAAQDLREVLSGDADALAARRVASFHRPAARMLAGSADGGQLVNLTPSANGKADGGKRWFADTAVAGSPQGSAVATPVDPSFFE